MQLNMVDELSVREFLLKQMAEKEQQEREEME